MENLTHEEIEQVAYEIAKAMMVAGAKDDVIHHGLREFLATYLPTKDGAFDVAGRAMFQAGRCLWDEKYDV